jgi:uncharacterized membrane protein YeiH
MTTTASRTVSFIFALDLAGTFLFAIEGAMAAGQAGFDFFGVLVLGFSVALIGGVTRDILIGAIPPQAIKDWRYPATAFAGGILTFALYSHTLVIPRPLLVGLDAAALSLFAIAGAEKALDFGINPFVAALMGTLTGVGGGTLRDVFLARVPIILRTDIYATAAFTGAVVMIVGRQLGLPPRVAAVIGGLSCFTLRVVAVWQHWALPRLPGE